MRTAVLLSTLAIAGMASAQLFQSGFEDWTGSVPDDWAGSRTNLASSAVSQVTDNVHGGTYAVRLENATSSHKRCTTQPVAVTAGQNYSVTFWVRGAGEIRVGLFDGRPGGSSGYATYTPYSTAGSAWQQVSVSISAANDTTEAEFVLSVRNSVAPEHIVVDDVTIGDAAPLTPTSIYDIQYTTDASGDSPYNLQAVLTGGVITAVLPGEGYFVQSGSGPWNGIYVYDQNNTTAIGDSVTFTANVSEYFNLTELSGVSDFTVVSSGNSVEPFDVPTGDVALEALESVLVRVSNASCTVAPSGATFGKYNVDDGTGEAIIGKLIHTTTPDPVVGTSYNITGVNYYTFGEYNIQPRMPSDVEFASGIAEAGLLDAITFGPNPATNLLHIQLGDAAGSQLLYHLTDLQGRTVQSGQLSSSQAQLSVSELPAGLYHLTLRNQALVKTFAVQVAH